MPFTFYPNPAKDIIHIKASNTKGVEVLEIFNLSGKKVLKFNSDVVKVNLAGLSEGIYLIRSKNKPLRSQRLIILK